jgi:uncharacterized SAM-binding protein YcdF (DUF218 family)
MTRRHALLVGALLCFAVAAVLWAVAPRPLVAMGRWLDVGVRPPHADYVMILTGDERTRPFVAAALMKAGLVQHALITEVADLPETIKLRLPPAHGVTRQVLLHRGIASKDITILPAHAATTHDEAVALATFLRDRPAARVIVVTSDYHTRRSRWIFARTLGEKAERLTFVSAPADDFAPESWWRVEAGFVTIANEYLKFAFYVVRYGHAGWWLAACCGLALIAMRTRASLGCV